MRSYLPTVSGKIMLAACAVLALCGAYPASGGDRVVLGEVFVNYG